MNNHYKKLCPTRIGYMKMKKTIAFSFVVVIALAASLTAFAKVSSVSVGKNNHLGGNHVEVASQGKGSCRHGGCRCAWYVRAQGGAGKCVCGHWDYVHN